MIEKFPGLFRALEIAKLGDLSVSISIPTEYETGIEDYNSIKQFCKGWFDNFVVDGDIKIGISKPIDRKGNFVETLEEKSNRIAKAKLNVRPDILLCAACQSLLDTATRCMKFSLSRVEAIKNVAFIIARLENSQTIKPEHIGESIQYAIRRPDWKCEISAEDQSISFGEKITIQPGHIEHKAIEDAIEFLKRLL